jgi:glycosyltransferase involved in cell wall biosynthesis
MFPVVFCGSDKGNESYIKQMAAELDLADQVKFLGFVPQEDLCSLYRNAFALTYVTFNGPNGLPPLEAFALGCPVVASKILGEQLGDGALLVDLSSLKKLLPLSSCYGTIIPCAKALWNVDLHEHLSGLVSIM